MARTEAMIGTEKLARQFAAEMGHSLGRFAGDSAQPGLRDAFCRHCGKHLEYRAGPASAATLRGQVLIVRCPR
jgi:hypothetical protein